MTISALVLFSSCKKRGMTSGSWERSESRVTTVGKRAWRKPVMRAAPGP